MSKTLGPSPGALRHPNHSVRVSNNDGRCTVTINGKRVADSRETLVVDETGYDRVIYFPRRDVRTNLLSESHTRTTCPFKGEARYFAANVEGETRDVAWTYPVVYDEVAPIAGHVAFYADRVVLDVHDD
ncbi:MAG: DUF427 domain-containing protein [Woeseiaceae bacterium]